MKTPTTTDERPICPICNLRISDKDFHYDGCDIMMHRHCDKEISKTPTPEEFLTKAEGFPNSSLNDGKVRLTRPKMIELMRDYASACAADEAEALYTERIKKAGSELPTRKDFIKWMEDTSYSYEDSPHEIYEWMKQSASVVIAKLDREKRDTDLNLKNCAEALEQKDKEIESYKEVLEDQRLLVIELDILINGEKGAAKQASLCDVVSQIKTMILSKII